MTKIIIKYTQENTVAKLIANEPQIIQRKAEMTAILILFSIFSLDLVTMKKKGMLTPNIRVSILPYLHMD